MTLHAKTFAARERKAERKWTDERIVDMSPAMTIPEQAEAAALVKWLREWDDGKPQTTPRESPWPAAKMREAADLIEKLTAAQSLVGVERAALPQEWESTERHIDEILRIATQDMTAAFGDSAEQYRREAIKAVLAAENWAGVCYERRRTAGQEWRDISQQIEDYVIGIVREVAELPDRTSPGYDGDMMVVTADELASILRCRFIDGDGNMMTSPLPAPPVAEPKETP